MKIISYRVRAGGYVVITTDKGEFAYPIDKFNSVRDLNKEINAKLKEKTDKKVKKDLKKNSFLNELDAVIEFEKVK